MTDDGKWQATGGEVLTYLLKRLSAPTCVAYGEGRGAIGARRTKEGVAILLFSDNGFNEPQPIGTFEPDSPAPPRRTRADVVVTFGNRESLESMQRVVERARSLFDEMESTP